jgi:hypothetical protein
MDESDPDVYCQLPEDYPLPSHLQHIDRSLLCGKLNAAIYGLKQASRKFYITLQKHLLETLGFTPKVHQTVVSFTKNSMALLYGLLFSLTILSSLLQIWMLSTLSSTTCRNDSI